MNDASLALLDPDTQLLASPCAIGFSDDVNKFAVKRAAKKKFFGSAAVETFLFRFVFYSYIVVLRAFSSTICFRNSRIIISTCTITHLTLMSVGCYDDWIIDWGNGISFKIHYCYTITILNKKIYVLLLQSHSRIFQKKKKKFSFIIFKSSLYECVVSSFFFGCFSFL